MDASSSHLFREIHEQPAVLERLLAAERTAAAALAAEVRRRRIGCVVIAARGSSDNAARYAGYLLGAANGLLVAPATPSLYTLYHRPPRLAGCLVLGISQSGRSPDIVAVLEEGRRQGALTAALSNDPASPLAAAADHVLRLHAGEERSVAATKTYTAQLAALALLSTALDPTPERECALERVPEQVAAALRLASAAEGAAGHLRHAQSCVVVGRGYNYATAFEIALKLKELTYTPVEPYSSADFLHGPLALVGPGFPVLALAPSGAVLSEMLAFLDALRRREAGLLVFSDDEAALGLAQVPLRLPAGVPEWLSPLTAVVPGQLLALHLALARGLDPDRPRALRKITETR